MNRAITRNSAFLWLGVLVSTTTVHAIEIERPAVQFVDKLGVNMANGQVTNTLNTVSIGGAMGLSHSVSVYANEFNYPDARGFGEKYYNRAENVQLCDTPAQCPPFNVMRVQDWSDSQSFSYGGATGYTPISDERHSLEVSDSEFLWTKPDGTVVHFQRPPGTGLAANIGGVLNKVVYPNGFTITVAQGSVNTNTGFQLKYFFTGSNPPHSKTEPPNLQAPIYSLSWPLKNPQYIRGINAWKTYCKWTTETCDAGNEWPTAKFEWPAGMPRTMHIGWSEVKITDSAKRTTTYRYQADDLATDEFGAVIPPYNLNQQFSPRLKEIIPPGATAPKFAYVYKNLFMPDMNQLDRRLQTSGVIKSASRLGDGMTYTINQLYMGSETQNLGGEQNGIYVVHQRRLHGNPAGTYYIQTLDGRIEFEQTARNFPTLFQRSTAPSEQYFYETRSNLTKLTRTGEGDTLAEFPATCTNRKTCNQATRIRDPNGNWTDYAYHADSGQIEKITYPANKEGIRAETRFTYEKLRATYYKDSPVKAQVPLAEGIWLKTHEEYCINSSASGSNCALGDEVVTTYEYNHPNLLMTGMLVTSPSGSRRTCFKYDDFGNQIEVTTPNANLASCPGVTP